MIRMMITNDDVDPYACLGESNESDEDLQACSALCGTAVSHIHSEPGNDNENRTMMMMKYDPGIQRAWPAHALGRRRCPHLCLPCLLCREGGGDFDSKNCFENIYPL